MNLNHLNVQKIALISIHLLVVMNYIWYGKQVEYKNIQIWT